MNPPIDPPSILPSPPIPPSPPSAPLKNPPMPPPLIIPLIPPIAADARGPTPGMNDAAMGATLAIVLPIPPIALPMPLAIPPRNMRCPLTASIAFLVAFQEIFALFPGV